MWFSRIGCLVRNRLKGLRHHPGVLDGFVAETTLAFDLLSP